MGVAGLLGLQKLTQKWQIYMGNGQNHIKNFNFAQDLQTSTLRTVPCKKTRDFL